MSEKNEKLSLVEIWNTLSENAQLMVISFAPAGGLSQSSEIVDMMAKPNPKFNWDGFDAVSAIEELENFGVLEEINGLEENKEMLTKLKRPPEVLFKRTTEMSEQEYDERTNYQMTKQDREYMRIWDLVIDVEKGVKEAPERYEHWLKPRFRLKADFQKFVEDLIDQE